MTLGGEIHLWHALRAGPAPSPDSLSPEERARAARFRFERHRQDYIFHHANLRCLLRRYLGAEPVIGLTPLGKPVLGGGGLHFNLSHSGPAGLYGFAAREIGVDIERLRPMPGARRLAARFFTPRECQAVADSPDAFFACWTRKEALLKAAGEGLRRALDSIEVYPHPLPLTITLDRPYTLLEFPPIPGCAAALAIEGAPTHAPLSTFEINGGGR